MAEQAIEETVTSDPVCPDCGGSLDLVRTYKGTESFRVKATSPGETVVEGEPPLLNVAIDGDRLDDSYDEVLSERIVCHGDCGYRNWLVGEVE